MPEKDAGFQRGPVEPGIGEKTAFNYIALVIMLSIIVGAGVTVACLLLRVGWWLLALVAVPVAWWFWWCNKEE